jgi:hypothetical protein
MGPSVAIDEMSPDPNVFRIIPILPAGTPISRGCFSISKIPQSGPIVVEVFYTWPLVGKVSSVKSYFVVKITSSSFASVPEAGP